MPAESRKVLEPSDRKPLAAARAIGPVPRDERFEVTVRVRRRTPIAQLAAGLQHADQAPATRTYMSREEYAAKRGADPADIDRIERFAREGAAWWSWLRARRGRSDLPLGHRGAIRGPRSAPGSSTTSAKAARIAGAPASSRHPRTSRTSSRVCSASTIGPSRARTSSAVPRRWRRGNAANVAHRSRRRSSRSSTTSPPMPTEAASASR